MIDVEHGALRAFEHHRLAIGDGAVQQQRSVGHERSDAVGDLRIVGEHLVGIQRLAVEQGMRDGVLLAAGVLNVLLQQGLVEQVLHTQSAARHLVFVSGPDTARSGADLHAPGSVLRCQLNHAVVGKDHVRAVTDKQIAVNMHAGRAQRIHFLHEGEGIEHHPIADHAAASLAQHAA